MSLYTLAPSPWLIFLDDDGRIIPNGQLAIYAAGTMTPATVYTTSDGVAHPFPITLDSAGRVPGGLYLQPGQSYKFVLHAPLIEEPLDGAIIKSQDNVNAVALSGVDIVQIVTPGDVVLDVTGVTVIEYAGSGDLHLRGMTGGMRGQSILIRNLTGYVIWLHNDDASAPLDARLVNLVATGPMPCMSQRSSARYTRLANIWWMDTFEQGDPIIQPFAGANYFGDGAMSWRVEPSDVIFESFFLTGRSLAYSFFIVNTSVSGTPGIYLLRRMPFGWRQFNDNTVAGILASDAGAPYTVGIAAMYDNAVIRFEKTPHDTPWTLSSETTSIVGRLVIILN